MAPGPRDSAGKNCERRGEGAVSPPLSLKVGAVPGLPRPPRGRPSGLRPCSAGRTLAVTREGRELQSREWGCTAGGVS